jgi:precorrin-6x reductase
MSQKELLILLDTLQFIFTKLELIDSSHPSARACLTRVVAIASAAQLGQTYFVRPLLFSKG